MVFTLPLLLHRGSTPSPFLTPANFFPLLAATLSFCPCAICYHLSRQQRWRQRGIGADKTQILSQKNTTFFGAEEFLAQSLTNTPVFPEIAKKIKAESEPRRGKQKNSNDAKGIRFCPKNPTNEFPFLARKKSRSIFSNEYLILAVSGKLLLYIRPQRKEGRREAISQRQSGEKGSKKGQKATKKK